MRYRAFSTGVYSGLPSPIYHDCRVMITAHYSAALAAFINAHGKWHLLPVAAIAANLARVSWINSFKRPASVLSFAFRHSEKAPPSYIAYSSGEMAILDHPAYVQIFDSDRVKTSDQIGRYLMVKIFSTARYSQMRFGDFDSLLRPPFRSLLSARKSPLLPLQIVHRAFEMARVLDLFAVRECGETANADIHTNGLSGRRHWLRFGRLANNQSIPAVNTARDPKLFALSFNRTGETDAATTNAWDYEFVAFERARPDAFIFLRKRMIPIFALESRKARLFSVLKTPEKALESFVNAFKSILLNASQVAFDFRQRAGFSQMARLFDIAKRLACELVTRYSFGEGGVVDLARVFKLTLTCFDKAFVDAKLELESLDCGIFGTGHRVQCLNHCARWQDLMKSCYSYQLVSFIPQSFNPLNSKFGR
jgi:hypothetical protein